MNIPIIVLLVEDEILIRMEIAYDLSERGFQVHEASNSQDAIVILNAHADIQLLFTDIDMPGHMDGLMLAAETHIRWPLIKIMVTSGMRSVGVSQMPPESRFFSKPYRPDTIATAMLEMVA